MWVTGLRKIAAIGLRNGIEMLVLHQSCGDHGVSGKQILHKVASAKVKVSVKLQVAGSVEENMGQMLNLSTHYRSFGLSTSQVAVEAPSHTTFHSGHSARWLGGT